MPSRTLAMASVLGACLAGAWLAGCDSGHNPTVRHRTLAVGGPSAPAPAAQSGELPAGHPKVRRPPRTAPESPLGPTASQEAALADRKPPAHKPGAAAPAGPSERVKGQGSAPAAGPENQAALPPKDEGPPAGKLRAVAAAKEAAAPKKSAPAEPSRDGASAASGGAQEPGDSGELPSRHVKVGNLRLEAPRAWLRKKPLIDFILAAFVLPRAPGDPEDGQVTVTVVGRNDPERLNQLREELKKSSGAATVEYLKINGVEVILVDASANYGEMPGVFAPQVRQGRYRVLNAIVPAGEKLYFVHCSGPEKTVGNYARQFRDFLLGMKAADAP